LRSPTGKKIATIFSKCFANLTKKHKKSNTTSIFWYEDEGLYSKAVIYFFENDSSFYRIEGNTRFKLRVLIGTEKIDMVNKHRILGLTFDERLNWKEHRKDVKGRVTRKLNLLKSLSHTSWGSDQKNSCGSTK
jgi:hypothetical protein